MFNANLHHSYKPATQKSKYDKFAQKSQHYRAIFLRFSYGQNNFKLRPTKHIEVTKYYHIDLDDHHQWIFTKLNRSQIKMTRSTTLIENLLHGSLMNFKRIRPEIKNR